MIQIPPNANVLVMHEPISFRNGIERTAAVARVVLEKEPMDGAVFVFRNKGRHMLRILILRRERLLALHEALVERMPFCLAQR